jgi:large subunit ribosomal protein L10
LAITKERKNELVAEYAKWVSRSQAMFITQYIGINMKEVDTLRAKLRDAGCEFHIVKNTLATLALEQAGVKVPAGILEGSSAICFAFGDAPAAAKAVLDAVKGSEFVKIKGGILDTNPITSEGVKALADLPPLPVMRAQLLGVLSAPASKLVRTLAEPARSVAAVIKAYADPKEAAGEPAAA